MWWWYRRDQVLFVATALLTLAGVALVAAGAPNAAGLVPHPVWSGGVTTTEAAVGAEVVRPARDARLTLIPEGPERPRSPTARSSTPSGPPVRCSTSTTATCTTAAWPVTTSANSRISTGAGSGQFGTVTVTDDARSPVTVELAGRNWRNDVLVSCRTVAPAPPVPR